MDLDIPATTSQMPSGLLDFLIVLGVIALVALIAFFWVLSFRKDGRHRRKHHHHHHHHHRKIQREQLKKTASIIKELIWPHQHQRRHRREHRPINPTLAQTGGLPPLRKAEQPPPPPPPP